MKENGAQHKVIRLSDRRGFRQVSSGSDRNAQKRAVAITSGKGGVGKTNMVANLGFALSKMGSRVLILDADLGLGNLDVLLGLTPLHNISHVVSGGKNLKDILVEGPGGMKILPASSGIQDLTELSRSQRDDLLFQVETLMDDIDILLIDTAAGISSNVLCFAASAHEILVGVTPEPTSITDAYALMKVLSLNYSENFFRLIVNQASTAHEAQRVVDQLKLVSDRFLNISIDYLGYVLYDKNVITSVRRQRLVTELFPESQAGKCFSNLARNILTSFSGRPTGRKEKFFARSLLNFSSDTP
jgi:flagellar biosynthesis protein FlhG